MIRILVLLFSGISFLALSFQQIARPDENSCAVYVDVVANAGRHPASVERMNFPAFRTVSNSRMLIAALQDRRINVPIIVEPGSYQLGHLVIKHKVHLVSRRVNSVQFGRGTLLDIRGRGSVIDGFLFMEGMAVSSQNSRDHSLYVQADDVVIQNNTFYRVGLRSTVYDKTGIAIELIRADNVTIQNNTFEDMYGVAVKLDDFSYNFRLLNNDFLDSANTETLGEIVHIGNAQNTGQGKSPHKDNVAAVITSNYVRNWTLESELISVKSNFNEISRNFVEASGNSALVIRMGNFNKIDTNYIRGSIDFPVRISGEDNRILRNYLQGQGAMIYLHDGVLNPQADKDLKFSYWAANRNEIAGNVFSGYSSVFGNFYNGPNLGLRPKGNLISKNLIESPNIPNIVSEILSSGSADFTQNHLTPAVGASCESLASIQRRPLEISVSGRR